MKGRRFNILCIERRRLNHRVSDVKEVDDLFLDSKRSAKRLTENKEKYLE